MNSGTQAMEGTARSACIVGSKQPPRGSERPQHAEQRAGGGADERSRWRRASASPRHGCLSSPDAGEAPRSVAPRREGGGISRPGPGRNARRAPRRRQPEAARAPAAARDNRRRRGGCGRDGFVLARAGRAGRSDVAGEPCRSTLSGAANKPITASMPSRRYFGSIEPSTVAFTSSPASSTPASCKRHAGGDDRLAPALRRWGRWSARCARAAARSPAPAAWSPRRGSSSARPGWPATLGARSHRP